MTEARTPAEEILRVLEPDEHIEAVVLGEWRGYHPEMDPIEDLLDGTEPTLPEDKVGVPLGWGEARPLLEGEWTFENDYGSPDCFAVYVWTDRRVIFVVVYDGATCLDSVPRHPTEGLPRMFGSW